MRTTILLGTLLAPALIAGTGAASHSSLNCTELHTITTVATGVAWPPVVDNPSIANGEIILYYVDYSEHALSDWFYIETGKLAGLQEGRGEYATDEILGLDLDHNDLCRWPTLIERDLLLL
ncbi:MAG TPA: hypothetical protein VGR28_09020 [Candidatus Thermoplasmatota archaeon]|jgi:hypothetical protein|nr:hypothetical protein [Candidatus Thermoplasmatota archaeon]